MYAKIFAQIFDSSIAEDPDLRHTFMDLLVLANKDGIVDMTVAALARRTKVNACKLRKHLLTLESPDPDSRTPEEDGRRIVRLDPEREWGWQIVNFEQYHRMRNEDGRREYMRSYMRARRAAEREKVGETSTPDVNVNTCKHQLAHVDVDTDVNTDKETTPPTPQGAKVGVGTPAKPPPKDRQDADFAAFWQAYPKKRGRKAARKAWDKAKDRPDIDTITAVLAVWRETEDWTKDNGQFVPNPTTWINQGRWDDEPPQPRTATVPDMFDDPQMLDRIRKAIA